jgi:hypothetical protein
MATKTEVNIADKGTPFPSKFGILYVGDTIKVKLYENTHSGGTKLTEYTGELVYHSSESRFLIIDPDAGGLSFNLAMATRPEIIKKWDEE